MCNDNKDLSIYISGGERGLREKERRIKKKKSEKKRSDWTGLLIFLHKSHFFFNVEHQSPIDNR